MEGGERVWVARAGQYKNMLVLEGGEVHNKGEIKSAVQRLNHRMCIGLWANRLMLVQYYVYAID